jgi:hypothetical protein
VLVGFVCENWEQAHWMESTSSVGYFPCLAKSSSGLF